MSPFPSAAANSCHPLPACQNHSRRPHREGGVGDQKLRVKRSILPVEALRSNTWSGQTPLVASWTSVWAGIAHRLNRAVRTRGLRGSASGDPRVVTVMVGANP